MSKLNLNQRIVKIMEQLGAVGKGGTSEQYEQYHKIDDVDDKLRGALIEHGVIATLKEIRDFNLESIEKKDRYGNPRITWSAQCQVVIELANADDVADKMEIVGWGHGLDFSDKATGKAIAYATKAAYLTTFHLRGQPDNEEYDVEIEQPAEDLELKEKIEAWIAAVNEADSMESLSLVGDALVSEPAAIGDAVRSTYQARIKALKEVSK